MREVSIASDVAGLVWKIDVNESDLVEPDQTLLLIESMKMEIPVAAPGPGRVARLLVKPGDSVTEGQNVVVLLVE